MKTKASTPRRPRRTPTPKAYRKPEYILATATGYHCGFRSYSEVREFSRTRGPFLNPTIYRVERHLTWCQP